MSTPDEDATTRLVLSFADAAAEHGRCTEQGDSAGANSAYGRMTALTNELRLASPDGLDSLIPLLMSEDLAVQSAAAARLLWSHEEEAIEALERVGQSRGLVAFSARMTLREWYKGNSSPP